MMNYLIPWLLSNFIILSSHIPGYSPGILLDNYREGLSPNWEERSLEGRTIYQVTREDTEYCVKATSQASASALYYKIEYDTRDYPILAWRWKISHVLSRGDALKREGDDYAARLFVVFGSLTSSKTRVLVYIWASKLPLGTAVSSSHNPNFMIVAVESGSEYAGEWREETRNIFEDYRRYFGGDPPRVGAIAIMTDTDNTGEEATAWYGPIRILPQTGY